MGTETLWGNDKVSHAEQVEVKLNNPLMGTETPVQAGTILSNTAVSVKLNNPLMGTENFAKIAIKASFSSG